ncbi:hypothetical protein [Synoicihabitans lomoniglobus]|uniref:Uncharacterized protein n=1 Tax=Synoicihabitans lomoniglobus TaxID=2909285 RepID=A0AAF0CNJ0_9BACT|nr:hypothetical protein [Opitutaceae bacterium LMO-M01]WED64475.1 hypothetical protein PXH66_19215 [Opitutaceae bacterium LMO-M01]
MIRRDYLLAMIEQLGALARAATGKNMPAEKLQVEMEDLSGQWIGLPTVVLFTLPVEELHRLIADSERLVSEKCFLTAELFRTKAEMATDDDSRRIFSGKALYFYHQSARAGFPPEIQSSITDHITTLTALVATTSAASESS